MNTLNANQIARTLIVAGAIVVTGTGYAEEFSRTTAAAHLSMTRGFNHSSLPLLHRAGALNAAGTSTSLLQKLCPEPCSNVVTTNLPGNALRVANDRWSLDIASDGASARFRDAVVEERAHASARHISARLSAATLEKAGREFIDSKLSFVIVLGPDEELVPVRTDYRIEGGQDLTTGEVLESVVANRIVFGRTLEGVPVVGGGSTVVITFANDGSLESFQYDWPSYSKADAQAVVDQDEVFQRLQTVVAARTGVTRPTFRSRAPSLEEAARPVRLATDTVLQKLECGYYDPGTAARDANAPVQTGCVYHAVLEDQRGARRGFSGAVPAGRAVAPDSEWREADILAHGMPMGDLIIPGDAQ